MGGEYSYRLPRIRAISPTDSMDFIRFFFIDIVYNLRNNVWLGAYRLPRIRAISPTDCMDLARFFMVLFIFLYPPNEL